MRTIKNVIFTSAVVCFMASVGMSAEFFVAPNGSDSNAGSQAEPFKTLEAGCHALRAAEGGGHKLWLRAGQYNLKKGLTLDAAAGGVPGNRNQISAWPKEDVAITGGHELDADKFTTVTDPAILDRLPEEARGKVKVFSLPSIGLTEYGELPYYGHGMSALPWMPNRPTGLELFCGGKEMTLARWPNKGYTQIKKVVDIGSIPRNWQEDMADRPGYVPPEERADPPRGFTIGIDNPRLKNWATAPDAWMFGYWKFDWSDQTVEVASIDSEKMTITSKQPNCYGAFKKQGFYIYNLLEEIDQPGEWYLDRQDGQLYVYPTENFDSAKIELSALDTSLLSLDGAANLNISGLNLSLTRADAISATGIENVDINNCTISKCGGLAAKLYGKNSGFTSCHIFDTNGGITMGGGDRVTLKEGGNYVLKSHIHDFARIKKTYNPAVRIEGVGHRVSDNLMHDAAHTAIMIYGNDHIIEYNDIARVCKESDDMAAIYSGRNTTFRGTTVRYNYIHDVQTSSRHGAGTMGIYLDDLLSGLNMYGNVFKNIPMGIFINGGRVNDVVNNIFIDVKISVSISDWGFTDKSKQWGGLHQLGARKNTDTMEPTPFDYRKPPYTKYPHLAERFSDEKKWPKYNDITANVFFRSSDFHFWDRGRGNKKEDLMSRNRIENNFKTDDASIFVGPNEYELTPGSKVYDMITGFYPLPFDRMFQYVNP